MKEKILEILLCLYYIFAFLCSFLVINYYSEKNELPLTIIYIILCCLILYNKNKMDEKILNQQKNDINNTAILLDNINKFNYDNLQIIKKIEFNILNIKITLKDNVFYSFDYEDLFFLKSNEDLEKFDQYIFNNYQKKVNESFLTSEATDKAYINAKKGYILRYICYYYNRFELK